MFTSYILLSEASEAKLTRYAQEAWIQIFPPYDPNLQTQKI